MSAWLFAFRKFRQRCIWIHTPLRALIILAALIPCVGLFAQETRVPAPHKPVPPRLPKSMEQHQPGTLRSMVGGLWMTDANFKSNIYLRSSIETGPLSVTPFLYLSNGKRYQLPAVQLEPEGTAVINVNDALEALGISEYAPLSGYVEIQYTWNYDPICATVNAVDTLHSLIFVSSLRPLTPPAIAPKGAALPSFISDGMWWKEENDVTGFVALTNVTGNPMHAYVRVTDAQNSPLARHEISLAAHATKIVDLTELQAVSSTAGGLEVGHDGAEGGLVLTGELQDPAKGYSASMPLSLGRVDGTADSILNSYAELGLMTGDADPMMSFPSGTVFTPFSVARNVSKQAVTVTPAVYWMQNGAAKSVRSTAFQLNPGETKILDMQLILTAAKLKSYNGDANLVLDVQGKPHSVLLAAGSVDQTKTYVFQVVPRAVGVSASRTVSYWSTGNGNDTMVSVWNPADEAQDFIFTLNYSGGHYDYPIHLGPRATHSFNISELIHSQIPDANGNRIPADIYEGSAKIRGTQDEVQEILVAIDTGTYNVRKATCSYYCIWCDGYYTAALMGAPFGVGVGSQYGLTLTAQWDGNTSYNVTNSATWSSSSTNVATVAAGTVTGVNVGTSTISAYANLEYYYQYCAYDPSSCPSDYQNMGGSGQGNVVPCPTTVLISIDSAMSLGPQLSRWKTGVGIIASMRVGPTSTNYDGAQIKESVADIPNSNTCPSSMGEFCSTWPGTFVVGQGGTAVDGETFNGQQNIFYDQHFVTAPTNLLVAAGVNSCSASCTQTYLCSGNAIGHFKITYSFSKGTIGSTPVTLVNVTKVAQ